jgi:hypothetical protein
LWELIIFMVYEIMEKMALLCKPSLKLYTGWWCTRPLERIPYTFKGFTLRQSQLSWPRDLNLRWRNSGMERLKEDGDNCRSVCYLSGLPSTQLKGLLIKLETIPILKVASSPMFWSYCGALSCKFICVKWPVMNMTCGSCSSGCNLSRKNLKCNRFPKCESLCSWQAQMNQSLIWWGILLEWTS